MIVLNLSCKSSSAGFGGIGPDRITSKFSYPDGLTTSFQDRLLLRQVLIPLSLTKLKSWAILGFRRSRPIRMVFLPINANTDAIFMDTKVFPSPEMEEVKSKVRLS